MTPVTDPDLAVALDVLQERFSPVKPYEYRWEVGRKDDIAGFWARQLSSQNPGSTLGVFGEPQDFIAAIHCAPRGNAYCYLPPLDRVAEWECLVAATFESVDQQHVRLAAIETALRARVREFAKAKNTPATRARLGAALSEELGLLRRRGLIEEERRIGVEFDYPSLTVTVFEAPPEGDS